MSQIPSPDSASTGSETAETGGKTSFMDKVKSKAKDRTKKLKTKLLPGSQTGSQSGAATEDAGSSSSSSDSDEEKETPVNNTISGVTQPDYDRKLSSGDPSVLASGPPSAANQGDEDYKESKLSKDFEGLSTKEKAPTPESGATDADKPVTEKATDTLYGAKDEVKEKLGTDGSEQSTATPDAVPEAVKPSEETKQAAEDVGNTTAEAGKSWSQWAAEKVGYGKDVAAEKLPTTADGTSAPDAAVEKTTAAKDYITQKTGEVTDTVATKAGEYQSSVPSDPAQRTYVQKATTHATAAKDSFITNTHPGEHDKALSEKVTESVGNLPTLIKSSLGFGGSAQTSTTPDSSTSGSDAAAPQSPSIVGRFTSIFAGKKPPSSESSAATKDGTNAE